MKNVKGKRIFVGLSGGVDSAVTAALLQKEGALVTGVFIKGWYPPGMPCTWATDRRDAMRVAAHLHIPFVTLDAEQEYKQGVIDYLLSEYEAGRTPNPDIMCNREVKFGAFWRFAKAHGADFIATGHYAIAESGHLLRGLDPEKDQSYFLWAVPQEALTDTIFPLGSIKKEETRKLAKRFSLPNATKKDSQGICFLGNISVHDFLKREIRTEEGQAVNEQGKSVGKHDGAILRTIGERVSLTDALPGPWYVVRKDLEDNVLVVSKTKNEPVPKASIALSQINQLSKDIGSEVLQAQYRYHGLLVKGTWDAGSSSFVPSESLPEHLAEGQSLVLYRESEVVLGGIIT